MNEQMSKTKDEQIAHLSQQIEKFQLNSMVSITIFPILTFLKEVDDNEGELLAIFGT